MLKEYWDFQTYLANPHMGRAWNHNLCAMDATGKESVRFIQNSYKRGDMWEVLRFPKGHFAPK